jgi:hypothetical protein
MTEHSALPVAAKPDSDKGRPWSGNSPSPAGGRAVIGDHPPSSIRPIALSGTPLGVQRSVGGG